MPAPGTAEDSMKTTDEGNKTKSAAETEAVAAAAAGFVAMRLWCGSRRTWERTSER